MARYEHLSIYKAAFDLNLYFEKVVRNFSRYHKYTLGTELHNRAREVVRLGVVEKSVSDRRSFPTATGQGLNPGAEGNFQNSFQIRSVPTDIIVRPFRLREIPVSRA